MFSGLFARIGSGLALVGGVLAAVLYVRNQGKQDAENEQAVRNADAQRRATDAYLGAAGDPAAVRKRLRSSDPW
jgi:type II secretory pathway pseudopilin PulG